MADLTLREGFSALQQVGYQSDRSRPSDAGGSEPFKMSLPSEPSCRRADSSGAAREISSERLLLETFKELHMPPPTSATESGGSAASPKLQRLHQMQRNLMEHQQQLLRQREHLQQQQLLLFQRSQERTLRPQSLAQLFAELHESRQQQHSHVGPRSKQTAQEQNIDDQTTGVNYRLVSASEEADLPFRWAHQRQHERSAVPVSLKREGRPWEQNWIPAPHSKPRHRDEVLYQGPQFKDRRQGGGAPAAQCWIGRRRMLRAAALLDADTVLKCTLASLEPQSESAQMTEEASQALGVSLSASSSSSSSNGRKGAADSSVLRESISRSLGPPEMSASRRSSGWPHDSSSNKVMQVYGEPLPPVALCAGISEGSLWRHCLRVTLNARRCAIKTRRSWKALVPLFPRRSSYSSSAVLPDDDLSTFTHIGPRASPRRGHESQLLDFGDPPKEPFIAPGLYLLNEEGGSLLAAWAVALDRNGQLRRCTATLSPAAANAEGTDTAATGEQRLEQHEQLSPSATVEMPMGEVYGEEGTVAASRIKALKRWYAQVAKEQLAAQQMRSLTLEEYAAGFGKYAEALVANFERLVETRHAATNAGSSAAAEGCGCRCSICVGLPCRIRVAWRRQLMAFEVIVDKSAAQRPCSDSSGEESGGGAKAVAAGSILSAAASTNRKGRWEWCKKCPLGCRMQFCLILHELFQPLVLTRVGLRSALANLLLRLRRYVSLSPLGVHFLMQRLKRIRSFSASNGRKSEAASAADDTEKGEKGEQCVSPYSWAARDWAEVCWQRRSQHQQTHSPNGVIASTNLDASIKRLALLATALQQPAAAAASTDNRIDEPSSFAVAADGKASPPIAFMSDMTFRSSVAESAAEQLRFLARGMVQGQEGGSSGAPYTHAFQAGAGVSAVSIGSHEYEEDGAKSPSYLSYPVSIASSQVPSACSTPPQQQGSRPPIGRCFAHPRSASAASQAQHSDGPSAEFSSAPTQECQLHIHCDGTTKTVRGRGFQREEWRRTGRAGDGGYGGDRVDSSPRGLRRMQRARLTSEEAQQPPAPRCVEIPRRIMPLVPWWWEEYIRTGTARKPSKRESIRTAGSGDYASDGASSVSSTVSLTAAPHLFRLPCGEAQETLSHTTGVSSSQTIGSPPTAMMVRLNEALDVQRPPARDPERGPRTSSSAGDLQADAFDATGAPKGEVAFELIHAASQLVDSLDSWPTDFGMHGDPRIPLESQGRGSIPAEAHEAFAADGRSGTPDAAASAVSVAGLTGRRMKQAKETGRASAEMLQGESNQGMLTFVSSILSVPSDGEVECLRGFELIQGVLYVLFSSTDILQEGLQQQTATSEGSKWATQNLQGGPFHRAQADQSTPVVEGESVCGVSTAKAEQPSAAAAQPAVAQRDTNSPPFDMYATTPLLRSLAASAAPPVETQDKLAVDDFYARPLVKRAVSYGETYEPFDKDYADIQIRLKPLRVFGLRQQRYTRLRRRSWRQSPQSSGSSPRYNSPPSSRPQGATGLGQRNPLQCASKGRMGSLGALGDRSSTVRIGSRRVVVRTVDGGSRWASREPSAGGLSEFSVSRCSMSVDSSLSSRGVSVCSRATSNAGSASDASVQGGTPQSPTAQEGAPRHRRGRSRQASGGRSAPAGGGNASTPTGVYLDVARKLWRCQWRENGRFKTKSFPLNQYKTLKEARRACVIFRCLMGGWEVQPAWLGDDEGGEIEAAAQKADHSASAGSAAGLCAANPGETET